MYGKSVRTGPYISRTYRIEAELGSGGSGAVYLAWHNRLRKHVVIKAVLNCIAEKIEIRRNEVEALKRIKHMNIPHVLDFFIEQDSSFTIMEYIEGESFDKRLKLGQRFNEAQIITWYSQLASALNAIHTHEVYHRDIKPANIILSSNENVSLIDFNSALVSGNNTGTVSRSMGYASPEQYEYFKQCRKKTTDPAKTYPDYAETALLVSDCVTEPVSAGGIITQSKAEHINWKFSDIYSLGATMYHLLTGKRPPVKTEETAKISKHLGYNKTLLNIIERSMQKNPTARFTTAQELVYRLSDI